MAVVTREGGRDPIVVNSWQDAVKDVILDKFYDEGQRGASVDDAIFYVEGHLDYKSVKSDYFHKVTKEDIRKLAKEMFIDVWVEVSDFDLCAIRQCLQQGSINMDHILDHARLKLTTKGYDKVQEHIFP